jgi:L-seryl-tRNA(Ser) seleniumtransferase
MLMNPDRQIIQQTLREIPAVDELLHSTELQAALQQHPRKLVVESIRQILEEKRKQILALPEVFDRSELRTPALAALITERLKALGRHTLRPVVNATGIVVHTNLGRSLLPEVALERLMMLASCYNNLEYDLAAGKRGSRYVHAESILCEITGAEAALVVNNNAGAVMLVLNTLAKNSEVIVSRGQLVEIGGSFRIPDVMTSSGAILREVGCTNRTHVRDYEAAINDTTALLMKVHNSNYRILGFTAEVSLEELVALGRSFDLPVVEDLGSGSFVDFSRFGLQPEPTAQDAIRAGADVVTFSGDKLLGGPQAGIILGRGDLVARFKKNPLTRALRVDKLTLAALEATLRLYRDEAEALTRIPTLRMIATPLNVLQDRAVELASQIRAVDTHAHLKIEVQSAFSQVGGGSLPAQDLPTFAVAIQSSQFSTHQIEHHLRNSKVPVIGRIESNCYLLDVRTLRNDDFNLIADGFAEFLAAHSTLNSR